MSKANWISIDHLTLTATLLLGLLIACFVTTQAHAFGGSRALAIAKQYDGKNPTGWSRNWCGKFMDMTLRKAGKPGGGNLARGYLSYGKPTGCRVGAIAVMSSHVGYVTACHKDSTSVLSGNHAGSPGRRAVGYGRYRNSRILAYRMP